MFRHEMMEPKTFFLYSPEVDKIFVYFRPTVRPCLITPYIAEWTFSDRKIG